MKARLIAAITHLTPKRIIALGIAPGLLGLGLDAAISHFAGREMAHPAQLIPVVFAPIGAVALAAFAAPHRTPYWFRRGARWVGCAAALVGVIGTGFHLRALARLLEGAPLTFEGVKAALAVAPPMFAAAGFAGIGGVVWMLGNPRLNIAFAPPPAKVAGPLNLMGRAA